MLALIEQLEDAVLQNHGWEAGVADRNGRYVMVIDHGKVAYAEVEKDFTQVTVSGVDPV